MSDTVLTQNEIKILKETSKKIIDHEELKSQIKEEAKLRENCDEEIKSNYIERFNEVNTKIDRVDGKVDKVNDRLFGILITIVTSIVLSTIFLFVSVTWDKIWSKIF